MQYQREKISIMLLTYFVFLLPVNIGGISSYNYVIFVCLLLNISKFLFLLRKFIVWTGLLVISFVFTALGSLDFYLHLQGFFALTLTLAGIALFINLASQTKYRLFVGRVFSVYLIILGIWVAIEMFGLGQIYYGGGERFGIYRPFLFSNPIAISTSVIGALLVVKRFGYIEFLGISKLIIFASFTSLLMFYLTRSIFFKILAFLFIIPIIFLFVDFENIGSFGVRLLFVGFAIQSISDLDLYGLFFGVGLRCLDKFNSIYGHLTLTNDITFYMKVLLESGFLGLALLLYRLLSMPFVYSGLLTLLFFTSVDQHFYFWSLGFLLVGININADKNKCSNRDV